MFRPLGTLSSSDKSRKIEEVTVYFIEELKKRGYTAYLAGGAAISFYGARRPPCDVDLRIDQRDDLVNFREGGGKILLEVVNQLILPAARRTWGATINNFHFTGEEALTVGTENWDGMEVSISIYQGFAHNPLQIIPLTGIMALDPLDLLRDKLKTVITRTKTGKESVKKVSQDLFDVLSLMQILPASETRDIEALIRQFRERTQQYAIANLEQRPLPAHFQNDLLAVRMLDRFLFTVDAHIQKGPRQESLMLLLHEYDAPLCESLGMLHTLDIREYRPGPLPGQTYRAYWDGVRISLLLIFQALGKELRQTVVDRIISYADELDLRPWFSEWNREPFKIPRRVGTSPPTPLTIHSTTVPLLLPPSPSLSPASSTALVLLANAPQSVKGNSEKVLYILTISGGFRALVNSKDDLQTQNAFGLSKSQFARVYAELGPKGKKWVAGADDGLHLTELGKSEIQKEHPDWKK